MGEENSSNLSGFTDLLAFFHDFQPFCWAALYVSGHFLLCGRAAAYLLFPSGLFVLTAVRRGLLE